MEIGGDKDVLAELMREVQLDVLSILTECRCHGELFCHGQDSRWVRLRLLFTTIVFPVSEVGRA
jgi:hypothetical protein